MTRARLPTAQDAMPTTRDSVRSKNGSAADCVGIVVTSKCAIPRLR